MAIYKINYNPNKRLIIEIESNDMSNSNGFTVWRVIAGERKQLNGIIKIKDENKSK